MSKIFKCSAMIVVFLLLFHETVFSVKTRLYDYLILCPDINERILMPYATGLSKIGIRTRIITYKPGEFEDIEVVKSVIRDEFLRNGIEYVTLIGSTMDDGESQYIIPMQQYITENEFEEPELVAYSDMVYGSFLDPGNAMDVYVGRIPFEKQEKMIQYLENMQKFWKEAETQNKNILLTGSWLWMQHCQNRECLLRIEDDNQLAQPPYDTIDFHLRESIDKADLIEQIIPLYFPEEYTLYRLYELEGLRPSIRRLFADDSLTEENFIKYYNESNPDIVLLSGALDREIGQMKMTPALYRKIWKEDINQDNLPNSGEMGYPAYLTDKSIDHLKSDPNPIVISDASFMLNPELRSIGKEMLSKGAIGVIGNTGFGITTYIKNRSDFYENGPYGSIFLESLLLKSLRMGNPIGKAFTEMQNTVLRMNGQTWTHTSMNLFGDPLVGFYNLPLQIGKTVIKTNPVDGEQRFEGKKVEIQFNYPLIATKKDLQEIKEKILITELYQNLNIMYTPSWDPLTRTLSMELQNNLPPDTWFCLDIPDTGNKIYFHTKAVEEKEVFILPKSGKILEAQFGRIDWIPGHLVDVTVKLNELIAQGSTEIPVDQTTLSSLPSQQNWLYLRWQDKKGKTYDEQIPEGCFIRITEENTGFEEDLTNNLNSFLASYYNNINLLGKPVFEEKTRIIQYDWGIKKPNVFVNKDQFSAKWRGLFEFVEGYYRLSYQSDDGILIKIDGEKVIEQWTIQSRFEKKKRIHIDEGKHLVEIYYFENTGPAGIEVKWERE